MSLNTQQPSSQKHLRGLQSRQSVYQLYKKQRQITTEGYEPKKQQFQSACGNILSYHSDDEITFKHKQSASAISMPHFDEQIPENQCIAQLVIDENKRLRQQLKESRLQVCLLKEELRDLQLQLFDDRNKNEKDFYKQIIKELKSEILLTLTQNKQITEEINQLKQCLLCSISSQFSLKQQETMKANNKKPINVSRCRSNSLQMNRKQKRSIIDQRQEDQSRKTKELMDSIKCMYQKITGYRIDSLKQLWRWLKDLGRFYSYFRKWKLKAECCLQHLRYSAITNEELAFLIEQAIKLVQ